MMGKALQSSFVIVIKQTALKTFSWPYFLSSAYLKVIRTSRCMKENRDVLPRSLMQRNTWSQRQNAWHPLAYGKTGTIFHNVMLEVVNLYQDMGLCLVQACLNPGGTATWIFLLYAPGDMALAQSYHLHLIFWEPRVRRIWAVAFNLPVVFPTDGHRLQREHVEW